METKINHFILEISEADEEIAKKVCSKQLVENLIGDIQEASYDLDDPKNKAAMA